ncbi:MAG TPA: UDP-N-acetylmuramoyl-L-alanine--D-glutamate ligase [Rhodospirillaceae bacterium]|nr:UDP-N-acetylmuramoyl-L-alanine--D-glutamate ligase [Rhodospirillaceae bacterium]
MAIIPFLQGKTVAVMGLGKSGTATARALAGSGATVWAWDDQEAARRAGRDSGLTLKDLATADLSAAAALVWSPGIPHTWPQPHPVAERARRLGLRLICDIELLSRACPAARYIGITGTNGKSTTTSLIAHCLAAAGQVAAAGGNLGIPALDLPALAADGSYVLELSSYQLELLDQARFDIAVHLNISPDHLSRHGGLAGYAAAKASLFSRLKPGATAVIGVDDDHSRDIFRQVAADRQLRTVPLSVQSRMRGGISAPDGILIDDCDGEATAVIDLTTLATLPGRHNWQNACAAYAAARAAGIDIDTIRRALASFPGLAHRQELVAVIDGVAFVNDSKATNADAAEKALNCYDAVYWLAGGQAKEGGITALEYLFPRIIKAFLFGEAARQFAATLAGKAAVEQCGTLAVAVARAAGAARADRRPGAVVLLSPACASWDQFTSFEHRGEVFRQLVTALAGRDGAA